MGVVMHLFVEIDADVMAVPAQVVAGQIDQHHMFGILFRVVEEGFAEYFVLYHVATPAHGPGNRIDGCPSVSYFAMGFGRRAKNPETAKIEVEEVWRGVYTAQGPVHLKVVAQKWLFEPLLESTI